MEAAFRTLLTGSEAVSALIPPSSIVWGKRQGLPAIALHMISDPADYHMQGPSRLRDTRVQVDCWASTYSAAKNIADAVETLLSGYSGGEFQGVFKLDRQSGHEADQAAPDGSTPTDFYRQRLDFRARHTHAS